MVNAQQTLTIGAFAKAAGVNVETIRFYQRKGLLPEPDRPAGSIRRYGPADVARVRFVKTAQRLGFTLDEVADLLELGRHRHGKRVDAGLQQRAKEKLVEVEERIADLVTIRDNLVSALDAGCDDLLACASSACCPIPFESLTLHPESQPLLPVERARGGVR